MNMILRAIVSLLLLVATCAAAQPIKKNGTAGFAFLGIPVTARSASLGEASLALSDVDASAMFDNPAALGFSQQTHSLSVSYAPWFADIKNYASGYALKTEAGFFGVGLVMLDYGSIPRTVVGEGQKVYEVVGTYKAHALALGVTYAAMLTDRFAFGATAKYVSETIESYSASNVVLDGGILYFTGIASFRIAASVQNFGVNAKFINDEFRMPAVFKLGLAAELWGEAGGGDRMTLLAEALHPNDGDEKIVFGVEHAWMNLLFLRAGYKFFYDESTYALGIGLRPPLDVPVTVDFAYSRFGRLGNVLRLSVQVGVN